MTTDYVDIGTGSWDRQRRPSEAKLDRILQISPGDIRREGAVLDRKRFDSRCRGPARAARLELRARPAGRSGNKPRVRSIAACLLFFIAVCPCRSTATDGWPP